MLVRMIRAHSCFTGGQPSARATRRAQGSPRAPLFQMSPIKDVREVGIQDGQMKGKAASRKPGFHRLSLNFLWKLCGINTDFARTMIVELGQDQDMAFPHTFSSYLGDRADTLDLNSSLSYIAKVQGWFDGQGFMPGTPHSSKWEQILKFEQNSGNSFTQ